MNTEAEADIERCGDEARDLMLGGDDIDGGITSVV